MAHARRTIPSHAVLLASLAGAPLALADTWDNSAGTAQWSTATNWADNTEPTSTDVAIFPNPIPLNQATVLMTTTEFCSSLTFNHDYTLQGGQMFIINGGVSVANGRTATINTVINGSNGLAKTGSGTLRLLPVSSNSFSGPISISAIPAIGLTPNTLYVRSNAALGNTANDITIDGGLLQLDGITNPTFLITGRTITAGTRGAAIELLNHAFLDLNTALGANGNSFSFSGLGTVELNTASARTGTTFVSGVLLRLQNATALGTPGSAVLNSGAILEINNGSGTFAGTVNFGAGTMLRGGTGTHTYNGVAGVFGNIALSGGPASTDTLIIGSDGADVVQQGAGSSITLNVGTVRLSAANSYAGSWAIPNGVLEVGHPNALGTGTSSISITNTGKLRLDTPTLARDITLGNPGGGIELLQDVVYTGNIPIAPSAAFVPILGSSREFTLTGSNSSMTSSGIAIFGGAIGVRSLRVTNGASVSGVNARLYGNGATPTSITVSGVGSTWEDTGELWIGNTLPGITTLRVEAGASLSCPGVYIGVGENGAATVTGEGSTLTSATVLKVGLASQSTISVLAGADATALDTFVGEGINALGTLSVDGAGSTWTNQGILTVGNANAGGTLTEGVVNLSNGGALSCLGLQLGKGTPASSTLTISGGVTRLDCGSAGVLMSQNGASSALHLNGGIVDIHGNITDAGPGQSTFTLNGATLDMHNNAIGGPSPIDIPAFRSGTLKNVAQINNGTGFNKDSTGTLFLNTINTYTGATTVSEGTLYLVDAGGSNTGSGMVVIGDLGTLAGNGRTAGPVLNDGVVAPQGFNFNSTATLHMLDAYTQLATGALNIQIDTGGAHDALDVAGQAVLSGTLNVALLNGYQPVAGDSFPIIDAASINGTFDTLSAPALGAGLEWQVVYTSTQVQLRVGSGCSADVDDDGDYTTGLNPDGGVDINDLLAFLGAFEAGDIGADLDDDGADPANPDGGVDINDLLFFLARFEGGC